jgi:DNA-binding transcriptional MerR regulator
VRIAELAARTGVAARLLRYYEERGLLTPARDDRGWRSYDESDEARVGEIRGLIEAGLPTAAIVQLLGCVGDEPASQRRVTAELRAELTAVRDRLDSRIRCLARNRDALDSWLDESLRSHAGSPSGSPEPP